MKAIRLSFFLAAKAANKKTPELEGLAMDQEDRIA
jgi:hypothetical protein